jgi:hypothetical protein
MARPGFRGQVTQLGPDKPAALHEEPVQAAIQIRCQTIELILSQLVDADHYHEPWRRHHLDRSNLRKDE